MSEKAQIKKALAEAGTAKKAAVLLGASLRTFLRRMRAFGIPVSNRGRPKRELGKVRFTSHEDLAKENAKHWRKQTAETRFNAVGEIHDATFALYNRKIETLARIYSVSAGPSR